MKYNFMKNHKDFQSGQMLIIVIFTMVISLTVGLTLVSRTITNMKVSKQNEESQRAFQAAEAGIEQALKDQITAPGTSVNNTDLTNNAYFSYTIQAAPGNTMFLNAGDPVLQTKGIDIWLSDYPNYTGNYSDGSFRIYWGTNANPAMTCTGTGENLSPALEVVVLQQNDPKFRKFFLDPCASRALNNKAGTPTTGTFALSDGTSSITFLYFTSISVTNGIIAKVIPVYNSTRIGVRGTSSLKKQGKTIIATGTSGESTRKLKYFVSFPQIPAEIFPLSITGQNYVGD